MTDRFEGALADKYVQTNSAALRKLAAKDGWAFIPDPNWRGRGSDYCPEHAREAKAGGRSSR